MRYLKFCILFTLIMGLAACNSGGTNKPSVDRNNNAAEEGGSSETPPADEGEEEEPEPTPEPEPEPPATILLDGNLYFPVAEGVTWHYDNGDAATLITGVTVQGRELVSMQHSVATMPKWEYFDVLDNALLYGGLYASITYQGYGVEGGAEFRRPQRMYDNVLDKGAHPPFRKIADLVEPDGTLVTKADYRWASTVGEKTLISTGQFGAVPAVEVTIDIDLVLAHVLGIPVQTAPLIETTFWLSPGLGVVARSVGDINITLDRVDGIQKPVVFAFDQGSGLAEPPQQLLVNGSAVTDMDVDMVVAYGTSETDWLLVEFDGTGSWRLSLQGDELPRGIHGAVVQITRNGERADVPVSVLVR